MGNRTPGPLAGLARILPTGVPTLLLGLVLGIATLTPRWQGTTLQWLWPPVIGAGLGLIYAGLRKRDPLWPSIALGASLGFLRVVPGVRWSLRIGQDDMTQALLLVIGPEWAFFGSAGACLWVMAFTHRGAPPRTGADLLVLPAVALVGLLLAVL